MIENLTQAPKVQDFKSLERRVFRPDVPFYPPTDVSERKLREGLEKKFFKPDERGPFFMDYVQLLLAGTLAPSSVESTRSIWETGIKDYFLVTENRSSDFISVYYALMKQLSLSADIPSSEELNIKNASDKSLIYFKVADPHMVFPDEKIRKIRKSAKETRGGVWTYYVAGAAILRVIDPDFPEELMPTNNEWRVIIDSIKNKEEIPSLQWNYTEEAFYATVLSAKEIRFGEHGMEFVWGNISSSKAEPSPTERTVL